jgi:hypothetical protein
MKIPVVIPFLFGTSPIRDGVINVRRRKRYASHFTVVNDILNCPGFV